MKTITFAILVIVAIVTVAGCGGQSTPASQPAEQSYVGNKFGDKALFEGNVKSQINASMAKYGSDRVTSIGCIKSSETTARCIVGTQELGENASSIKVECSYVDASGGHECMFNEELLG